MDRSEGLKPFKRDQIYKNENQIQEELGEYFNPVINHRQKEKDTFKHISPASGLWSSSQIYKSTNQVNAIPGDIQQVEHQVDKTYFMKMDPFKKYCEEMSRTIKLLGKGNVKGNEAKSK
jgi:hypothetical protein